MGFPGGSFGGGNEGGSAPPPIDPLITGVAGVITLPAVTAGRRHAYVISVLVIGDDASQHAATITAVGDSTIGSFAWGTEPTLAESPEGSFGAAAPELFGLAFAATSLTPRITVTGNDAILPSACYARIVSFTEIDHTP